MIEHRSPAGDAGVVDENADVGGCLGGVGDRCCVSDIEPERNDAWVFHLDCPRITGTGIDFRGSPVEKLRYVFAAHAPIGSGDQHGLAGE
jgi:hypothetical protein